MIINTHSVTYDIFSNILFSICLYRALLFWFVCLTLLGYYRSQEDVSSSAG